MYVDQFRWIRESIDCLSLENRQSRKRVFHRSIAISRQIVRCFVRVKSSSWLFRECGENEAMLSMARRTSQNFFFSSNHLHSLVFRFVNTELNEVHSSFLQSASQLCLSLSTRWLPNARRTSNSGVGILNLEFNGHLFGQCWIDWTVCRDSLPLILLLLIIIFSSPSMTSVDCIRSFVRRENRERQTRRERIPMRTYYTLNSSRR